MVLTQLIIYVEGAMLDRPIGVVEAVVPVVRPSNYYGVSLTNCHHTCSQKKDESGCGKAGTHLHFLCWNEPDQQLKQNEMVGDGSVSLSAGSIYRGFDHTVRCLIFYVGGRRWMRKSCKAYGSILYLHDYAQYQGLIYNYLSSSFSSNIHLFQMPHISGGRGLYKIASGKERVSTLVVQISLADGLESNKVFVHINPNIYINPIKTFDGF